MAKKTQNNKSKTRPPKRKDEQKTECSCQKCGHEKYLKKCVISFCDNGDEKEFSLILCTECGAAFERLKQIKAKAGKLLTGEQWASLVIGFLAEKNPLLTACQKCGNENYLGRHHPYPQRWFGHSLVLCDRCHTSIEREIHQQERENGKAQKELPKGNYAVLTLKFITERSPKQDSADETPEVVIRDTPLKSQAEFDKINQTLVDAIVELNGASIKMGRIAAYLNKIKHRKTSWLQDESQRIQKIVARLQKMGDDFYEIEQIMKSQ